MKTAAITELKAKLSQYIDQVKAGAEVLITDRGRPVARLVPISTAGRPREFLRRMEKQGILRLGSGKLPKGFWSLKRPPDPQNLVRQALLDEREQGR